jgi:hypothetical protein
MTQTDAINFIDLKVQELSNSNFDPIVWTDTTCELLRKIFPITYQRKIESIDDIDYILTVPMTSPDMKLRKRQSGIQQANQYLQSYIQEINNHGLETVMNESANKKQDNPIIALISNLYFWGVLVLVIGGSFSLGKEFGNSRFDKEKADLYNENKDLKIKNQSLIDSSQINNQTIRLLTDSITKIRKEDKGK